MGRERGRESYLRKNLLGQTGALEEGDGFGSTDSAIAVQIGSAEIRIEEIHIRRLVLRRRHLRVFKSARRLSLTLVDQNMESKSLGASARMGNGSR